MAPASHAALAGQGRLGRSPNAKVSRNPAFLAVLAPRAQNNQTYGPPGSAGKGPYRRRPAPPWGSRRWRGSASWRPAGGRSRNADLDASRTPDAIRCETRGGSRLL
jgi:hypothetical protein